MSATIRLAILSDAEGACDVVRSSICELCVEDHQHDRATIDLWLANKTVANFHSWIGSKKHVALVAEDASGVVGFALLNLEGSVALLYVSSEARFQGISKSLLSAIEDHALRAGIDELQLNSSATARRLYSGCGFQCAGDPTPGFGVTLAYPMSKKLGRR